MEERKISFPRGFKFGVATAATQVDGASNEGGKGVSNWDLYPKIEGKTYQGQDASVACDHYHRYKEDIGYIKELGVDLYRLSFSWTRIIPNGVGEINEEGLRWYDSLFAELKKNNIEICATIFHWDYPYELIKKGGWLNPDSPKWFLEYVKVLVNRYKNIVSYWIPINEPPNVVDVGGVSLENNYSLKEKLQIIHNILLAHGLAAKYLKEHNQLVAASFCSSLYAPYDENNKEDIEAAKTALFDHQKGNYWNISIWADPIVFGKYPDKYFELYSEEERPNITEEDMKIISTPIDFFGYNIYTGSPVKKDGDGYKIMNHPVGNPKTDMNWEVAPRIMYWAPKFLYDRYRIPFIIFENGAAMTDILTFDKKVHDESRIEYLKQYLYWYSKTIEDGVDARGYVLWSLMDNYEWFNGYSKRFGLLYINYHTQERIKKDSFYWYKDLIEENHRQ